jgi:CheY-like chemotaxis protein
MIIFRDSFTELLKTRNLSPETQDMYLEAINASGSRMLDIIDALIDISRIETGELELKRDSVSIQDLLDEIFVCFQAEADKKGIQLRIKNELPARMFIQTDRAKLTQALSHLVRNAIRFTSEGYVEYGCRLQDDHCFFHVKDTGIGIKEEYRDQIFKHFRHGEMISDSQHGIGLGLAISKAYVELLGGTLDLDSEYGRGSVFSFAIPVEEVCREEKENPATVVSVPQKQAKVLIAEDDELIYFFIEEVLRLNQIKTFHANDGVEAVEAIQSNPDIDLILMDTRMSRMNGLEATRQIKKIRPDVPIIAQSAFVSEEDKERAFEAGCVDFIGKPIDRNLLLKKIALYTGNH